MKISVDDYKKFVTNKFLDHGVTEEHAAIVTEILLYADSRGIPSHGVLRLPHYIERLKHQSIKSNPSLQYNRINDVITQLNGDDGLGHVVAKYAMEEAISIAHKKGIGVVSVNKTSHSGAVGYYAKMAAEKNMIGLIFTQADALVAPYGGKEAYLGANPIAFGAPTGKDFPMVLDISTSKVSFGKVMIEKEKGNKIPKDWGLDDQGVATDNPADVVALQPMERAKGYGLAILVDILSGVLAGTNTGRDIEPMYKDLTKPRDLGQFFLVINPSFFGASESFINSMTSMVSSIQGCPPQEGFEKVYIPGERANLREKDVQENGIDITDEQYEFLIS